SDAERVPRELPPLADERDRPPVGAVQVEPPPTQLRRFYMAIAFSGRNRSGPLSAVVEVPITVLPPAPAAVQATYSEAGISLEWEPSGGLLGFLIDRSLPAEDEPVPIATRSATAKPPPAPVDWLPGPTRYNVYRDVAPDPLTLPA